MIKKAIGKFISHRYQSIYIISIYVYLLLTLFIWTTLFVTIKNGILINKDFLWEEWYTLLLTIWIPLLIIIFWLINLIFTLKLKIEILTNKKFIKKQIKKYTKQNWSIGILLYYIFLIRFFLAFIITFIIILLFSWYIKDIIYNIKFLIHPELKISLMSIYLYFILDIIILLTIFFFKIKYYLKNLI